MANKDEGSNEDMSGPVHTLLETFEQSRSQGVNGSGNEVDIVNLVLVTSARSRP